MYIILMFGTAQTVLIRGVSLYRGVPLYTSSQRLQIYVMGSEKTCHVANLLILQNVYCKPINNCEPNILTF